MRRLAAATGTTGAGWSGWVEELVGSSETGSTCWIVARRHLITGARMGLKHLAPLAGFEWEDDDPGGEQSMEWHRHRRHRSRPGRARQMRERILTYNRNDAEATLALREWMDSGSSDVPHIEDAIDDPIRPDGRGCTTTTRSGARLRSWNDPGGRRVRQMGGRRTEH